MYVCMHACMYVCMYVSVAIVAIDIQPVSFVKTRRTVVRQEVVHKVGDKAKRRVEV